MTLLTSQAATFTPLLAVILGLGGGAVAVPSLPELVAAGLGDEVRAA